MNDKNILIIRTDRIGDVILTTPAIAVLRKAWPEARLSLMVSPLTYEIVQKNPYLNDVIVYSPRGAHRGFLGYVKLIKDLRKRKFDLAINFHTKKRTNLICFLAGIPRRIGYCNDKFGFLLTQKIKDTRPQGTKHEYEYCLDVLRRLGISQESKELHITIKEDSEEWAQQFIDQNGLRDSKKIIAIHPGASCISKRWPTQSFADLINRLQEDSADIILIGAQESKQFSDQIKFKVHKPVVDATAKTTVSQLVSLLKRCQLLVSNDSGPVHVAVSVGTPVISIFGRNQAGLSPTRWRPLGLNDIVLHKEVGCEVCLAHNCKIDFACLSAITTDDVWEAVSLFFNKI